ncbi:MAG: hypothetical protein GYA39_02375, partial [Methanothrix sp.]|nr:hypothetical protein [Methanothrix sp.]
MIDQIFPGQIHADHTPQPAVAKWFEGRYHSPRKRKCYEHPCVLEDAIYNLTRPAKTLRIEVNDDRRRWQPRTTAMAAGLADHIWTTEELILTAVVLKEGNT